MVTDEWSRQQYETERTQKRENDVATLIAKRASAGWKRLNPFSYGLDFALLTNNGTGIPVIVRDKACPEVLGFLEVKVRAKEYDPWLVSALKIDRLERYVDIFIPGYLAWAVPKGSGYDIWLWQYVRRGYHYVWAGRDDRGDKSDMEPMVAVPWEVCQRFSGEV
jgi:hypothetical protein